MKAFNCAACASLLVTIWNVSGPVSRLQSPFGGGSRRGSLVSWIGGDALALFGAADAHGVEFSRQHVAGIDHLPGFGALGLLRQAGRRGRTSPQ